MDDIVAEALSRDRREQETIETDTDAFGELQLAYIGCGPEGIARVEDGTEPRDIEGTFSTPHQDPRRVGVGNWGPLQNHDLEVRIDAEDGDIVASTVNEEILPVDVVVVTANGSDAGALQQVATILESLHDRAMAIAIPTFSSEISGRDQGQLSDVVLAADATVPVCEESVPAFSSTANATKNLDALVAELAEDLFVLGSPSTAICSDFSLITSKLENAGKLSVYRGEGTRKNIPDLVETTLSNPLGPASKQRSEIVYGFIEFGEEFQNGEFDRVVEFLIDETDYCFDRGVLNGQTTGEKPDSCRLVLLAAEQ